MGQTRRAQAAIAPAGMQPAQAFDVFIRRIGLPEQLRTKAVPCLGRHAHKRARRVVYIAQSYLSHNPVNPMRANSPVP